jgi:hypothetical protein
MLVILYSKDQQDAYTTDQYVANIQIIKEKDITTWVRSCQAGVIELCPRQICKPLFGRALY